MPSLTFVLPHWVYWLGLLAFPLIAMYVTRRQRQRPGPRVSLPLAYLLLLTGGFVGLHRLYLRSGLGLVFILVFLLILFGNIQGREAQNGLSAARNEVTMAEFERRRAEKSALRRNTETSAKRLDRAEQKVTQAKERQGEARAVFDRWQRFSGGLGLVIVVLLVMDAVLLPRLVRRRGQKEVGAVEEEELPDWTEAVAELDREPAHRLHSRVTDFIDRINGFVGHFVAYWAVIAVFAYYYEVLARYVFNSPTNWAHEGMFLMFGMQYLLAGGFALREDAHVRVDVIYMHLPDRGKALVDVLTSLFFFIFAGALLWTGWVFAGDAVEVWEVSFTEWAIQYWPVKLAIPIGAVLLLLQGLAKLIKDMLILVGQEA